MEDKLVDAKGTCCVCGEEYTEKIGNREYQNRCENFDPTDWVCPDCRKKEDEAEQRFLDELFKADEEAERYGGGCHD